MVDDAFTGVEYELGVTAACRLTGRSRATHYRQLRPAPERQPRKPQVQSSALTPEERAAVLELMNSGEYAELPPAQIWARELDAGRYHCSVSTMYRILREKGQSGERRRQATHPAKTVPELVATGPSQVFTWDITKAAGPAKGVWYHAYVIIDIFSRYIVGHTVEAAESATRAEELIRESIVRNGIVPETVHADRGTSMTSKKVSNDNPYSEAHFKTAKYMSELPRAVRSAGPCPRVVRGTHRLLQPRAPAFGHRLAHARQRALRHRRGGPRPASRHPRRRIRPPSRTLRPTPPTTPDTPAGVDQRPGQAPRARSTNLIASRPSHCT